MEMFSTPALSFRNSENQDNIIRKNGGGKPLQRKPFLDRPVNSKTPLSKEFSNANGIHSSKNHQNNSPKKQLEDFDAHEYIFSYKSKENYECDVWPKPTKIGTEDIIRILRNYCSSSQNTPPPSPKHDLIEIDCIFTKMPKIVENDVKQEDISFESIEDVDIPNLDLIDSFSY